MVLNYYIMYKFYLLFIELTSTGGATITGTGAAIIISTWGLFYKMKKNSFKQFESAMKTKADKKIVSEEIDKVNIKIDNLTNLHKINKDNITKIETKIDNLSINMDSKLSQHQKQIIDILTK